MLYPSVRNFVLCFILRASVWLSTLLQTLISVVFISCGQVSHNLIGRDFRTELRLRLWPVRFCSFFFPPLLSPPPLFLLATAICGPVTVHSGAVL